MTKSDKPRNARRIWFWQQRYYLGRGWGISCLSAQAHTLKIIIWYSWLRPTAYYDDYVPRHLRD